MLAVEGVCPLTLQVLPLLLGHLFPLPRFLASGIFQGRLAMTFQPPFQLLPSGVVGEDTEIGFQPWICLYCSVNPDKPSDLCVSHGSLNSGDTYSTHALVYIAYM